MTGDDFERVFGKRDGARSSFTERVGRPEATAPPAEPSEQTAGSGAYKPYGFLPAGFGESCDVRRWIDATQIAEGIEFQYRFLMQIGYVGDEQLRLFLPDCIVLIEGWGLTGLRKRLARRQVTFIQQFSPLVWPGHNADEAVIERIEVVRPDKA